MRGGAPRPQPFARLQQAGERRVAGAARGSFQAFAGRHVHLHVHDPQRHLPLIADALAVGGPGVGGGLQPVVHVHGAQATRARRRGVRQQVQQHARVQPAAETDQHGRGEVR